MFCFVSWMWRCNHPQLLTTKKQLATNVGVGVFNFVRVEVRNDTGAKGGVCTGINHKIVGRYIV